MQQQTEALTASQSETLITDLKSLQETELNMRKYRHSLVQKEISFVPSILVMLSQNQWINLLMTDQLKCHKFSPTQ